FKMSVAGVAWATIIAQAISAVLVVICLMRRKGYGKLRLKRLRISKRAMIEIFKIGFPAGVQSTIFSFSNVIIQSAINSMGAMAVAGNAASCNIEGFVYIAMNAMSQACLTFTGQNFGANNKENCKITLIETSAITVIMGLALGVIVYFAGVPLLRLYNTDPEVIKFGLERIKIICLTYFTCGIMEVFVGTLRGMGKSLLPMIVSIVGVVGVRILWVYTVFAKTQNLDMLYWSYPISWVFTALVHFVCIMIVEKKVFGGGRGAKIHKDKSVEGEQQVDMSEHSIDESELVGQKTSSNDIVVAQ
ncbi:MAG: MATE family efflux transporter, partial [Clostridia bacterium]